ncbi:MAG TPA: YCF48-related protein [Nevskiaceae bacterium]|nr:YCF48-related protein [Nevskiaceae bacterium]
MKHPLTALFAATFALVAQAAAAPTEALVTGVAHDALFTINFDGQNGIAGGAPGRVLATHDGGKSWTSDKTFPSPLAVLGADVKGERTLAVGQMGTIFLREGSGAWKKIDSGSTERLMNVSLNSHGRAVAVGSFGTVLKSDDGGASWASIAPEWKPYLTADQSDQGIQPHMSAVQVGEDGVITIAGEFSLILRSEDGGKSWKQAYKNEPSIFALQLRGDGVGYAVGQDGFIARSADGGKSWMPLTGAGKAILLGVGSDGSHVVIAGMHDMLASDDDGKSFHHVQSEDVQSAWYAGVAVAGGVFYGVGHNGRIVKINS